MPAHKLTPDEYEKLRRLLENFGDVVVSVWGEGEHRHVSFHIDGTRLEVRIPLPQEDWE